MGHSCRRTASLFASHSILEPGKVPIHIPRFGGIYAYSIISMTSHDVFHQSDSTACTLMLLHRKTLSYPQVSPFRLWYVLTGHEDGPLFAFPFLPCLLTRRHTLLRRHPWLHHEWGRGQGLDAHTGGVSGPSGAAGEPNVYANGMQGVLCTTCAQAIHVETIRMEVPVHFF